MILSAVAMADASAPREALDDAWWTGPLLAASPATLPPGHVLIEPYLFESTVNGQFDATGARHSRTPEHDYGSLTYLLYGLTDGLTVGMIPRFAYVDPSHGMSSSGVGLGDTTVQAAILLSRFLDRGWLPAASLVIAETLPTGQYDQLSRRSDGVGEGAYTTTVSLYSQYYLWMPNGRLLRTRLDLSEAWSPRVPISDMSVYGTSQGFRGHAHVGGLTTLDAAWEYSVTRRWVAALDVAFVINGSTRLAGSYLDPASSKLTPPSIQHDSGTSRSLSLAPAVEYNWSSSIGIIAGVKWTAAGRNTSVSFTPVAALNVVL